MSDNKKMIHVAVYFTKSEFKAIKKNAGNSILRVSPYLRKFYVDIMKLKVT